MTVFICGEHPQPLNGEDVMQPSQKRAIWDVLVEHCGARPNMLPEFDHHFPQCGEFRFQGDLGFGGKVYAELPLGRVWVSCYPEDRTEMRDAAVTRANEALAEVMYVPLGIRYTPWADCPDPDEYVS